MKKKMQLKDLQIDSFVTNENQNLKGGTFVINTDPINTLQAGCLVSLTCPPPLRTFDLPCPGGIYTLDPGPFGCQ